MTQEGTTHPRNRWRVFWPEVDDLAGANEAVRLSVWFVLIAVVMSLIASASGAVDRRAGFTGAIVGMVIALGLQRKLRVAALFGTVLIGIGIVGSVVNRRPPGVVDVITFLALLNGVRGTFAYRRLIREAPRAPATPTATSDGMSGSPPLPTVPSTDEGA